MNKFKKVLKEEFVNGYKIFDYVFLGIGLILQIIAIIISAILDDDPYLVVTAISGITGVLAVVLTAQGKISNYGFAFIQLFTYLFGVAIPNALWGEVAEQGFYFVTMLAGLIIWFKRYRTDAVEATTIKAKALTLKKFIIICSIMIIGCLVGWLILTNIHNWFPSIAEDPQPLLDSITTVVPVVAQIYYMLGYTDQWSFWLIEDVMSLVMFVVLGNWIMVAQYIFWTANCIYGFVKWRKLEK